MADTVTTNTIFNGTRRLVVQLLNHSDGTGETDVVKVDISSLVGPDHINPPSKLSIQRIEWDIQGMNAVKVSFDATTNDTALLLNEGNGYKDFGPAGGLHDPQSSGSTGDILFTTIGATNNSTYDILIDIRLHEKPGFKLQELFSSGENGLLLTPWDLSTVYQDSAGTVPGEVGSVVGLLRDSSGNGNDAVQTTTALKPVLQQTDGYNGVQFDGLDDYIDLSAVGDLNGGTWTLIVAMDTKGDQQSFLLGQVAGDMFIGSYWDGNTSVTNAVGTTNEYISVDGVVQSNSLSRDQFYNVVNGLHTTIFQVDVAATYANAAFVTSSFASSWHFSGELRGLLLINRALTEAERANVHRVFVRKAGMPLLPSLHFI